MRFFANKMFTMTPAVNGTGNCNSDCILPKWLDNITLKNAVVEVNQDCAKILSVNIENYRKTIANNSALMLRFIVDYELKDGNNKSTTFVLKTQNDANEAMTNVLNMLKLFQKEEQMYQKIIPKFEQLYQEAGKNVKFAPKAFTFDRDVGVDYVLLEDLRPRDYKNATRCTGLDLEHMKEVLAKLAQFHAASACYVEHFGVFNEEFTVGVYNSQNRQLLKEFNDSSVFLAQLKKWKDCNAYYQKLHDCDKYLIERLLEDQKVSAREFNVLNHGDCWLNNIMFQYDAFGKIKNVLFVDFQVGKYGSPVNDLYYVILSSASMDIKLTEFDYMIRFYYDNLVENLKLLQYHRPLPKLKSLHNALLNNGLAAFMVVSKVLPLVMLDTAGNSFSESDMQDENKIKSVMYTNHKYVKAMAEILPWMDNRGLLDFK